MVRPEHMPSLTASLTHASASRTGLGEFEAASCSTVTSGLWDNARQGFAQYQSPGCGDPTPLPHAWSPSLLCTMFLQWRSWASASLWPWDGSPVGTCGLLVLQGHGEHGPLLQALQKQCHQLGDGHTAGGGELVLFSMQGGEQQPLPTPGLPVGMESMG